MEFRYDTYCGLNCGACDVLAANERGDEKWIKKIAEEEDRRLEDLHCHGCKTDTTAVYCTECKIRPCASTKGVEFCYECPDFPCETITNFRNDRHPHHSVIFKNLRTIKEKGVEAWLAEEKQRWACKKCGTRYYWYSKTCSNCGEELYNSVKENKDLEI